MKNKITDFDIKKSFVQVNYPLETPSILLDEYWEYYMDLFGQTEKYEKFRQDWLKEGFKTYKDFMDEYNNIINSIRFDDIFKHPKDDILKIIESAVDRKPWMPVIDNDDYINLQGRYLQVDLHHAFDTVFCVLGLYKDKYKSMNDVINAYTNHKIFVDLKLCRLNTYIRLGIANLESLFEMCGNLLKKVFESNHPIIKELNEKYPERLLSHGDMYLYKIGENDDVSHIIGDYEVDGIEFSIRCMEYKHISVFDSTYLTTIDPDKKLIDYNIAKNKFGYGAISLICPILLKLARNEQPTEKDLVIGYEDTIFFHLNENDYKIL